MSRKLGRKFYQSKDVLKLTQQVLGKVLVSVVDGVRVSGIITEAEAYRAPDDTACHATKHGLTPRTKDMYAVGGTAYIYLCYGIHHLFNIVTAPEGDAHAILIRAIKPLEGVDVMLKRRKKSKINIQLTGGPGTVGQAIGAHTNLSGLDMMEKHSLFWLEDHGIKIPKSEVITGPRVGCETAGKSAFWPWRYLVSKSLYKTL